MNGRILFDYGNSFFFRMERGDGAAMLKGNLASEVVTDGETEAGFWVKMLDGLKVCLLKVKFVVVRGCRISYILHMKRRKYYYPVARIVKRKYFVILCKFKIALGQSSNK